MLETLVALSTLFAAVAATVAWMVKNPRMKSDYQVTYPQGASVRRLQRGRQVRWYLDGAAVSEESAKAYMRSRETL